ncbi:MAG: ribosomal protein S18-alanine N-acetyltransferase [Calditrichia bacterium]
MRIRPMQTGDLDRVAELEAQIFSDPWSRSSFEFEVKHNRFSFPVVLEKDGELVGYAVVWKMFEELHVANIAISPDYQGQGLGEYLLQEILKDPGICQYALLEVRESNYRAIRLYEKYGFKTIMKRLQYYKDGETALVMKKDLIKIS